MGTAGQLFTEAEADDWQHRVQRFMSAPEPDSQKKQTRRIKAELSKPRQASLDFLRAVQHQMLQHFGFGFEKYDCKGLLSAEVPSCGPRVLASPPAASLQPW